VITNYAQTLIPATYFKARSEYRNKSLQQANVTELGETMVSVFTLQTNDQWQSFRPLVNSITD